MIEFNHKQQLASNAADQVLIKVVGLGGAGLNVIDRIVLDGAVPGADLVVMNTDVQSLTSSVSSQKVQLGRGVTRGLGAGGDPELGLAAAEEAQEDIRKAVEGAGLIFLCVGLGGGTGSGAAPLVTSLARENGALVVVIATMPFAFEGKRRSRQAEDALITLQATADAVICFENDLMGEAVAPKAGIHQAFAAADETISQCVRAVSSIFSQPGILHIGFDDLCSALRPAAGAGRCLFGYGEATGDNRAHEALARALRNPLMDRGRMLDESHNVLVNVAGGPDMTFHEVQTLMDALAKFTGEETQMFFGAAVDQSLTGRIGVTVVSSAQMTLPATAAVPAQEFVPRVIPTPVPAPKVARVAHHEPAPAPEPEFEPEPVAAAPEPEEELVLAGGPEPVLADATADAEEEGGQSSFLGIASAPAVEPQPAAIRLPRPPRQPRILSTASDPSPIAATAAAAKREEKQETLQFEPVTRGRFEKSEPTIVDGQDLDVPTFLRRNVKVS